MLPIVLMLIGGFLPRSYNFSGNLFIVDNDLITPIDAPSDEVMKFIVSGGITRI